MTRFRTACSIREIRMLSVMRIGVCGRRSAAAQAHTRHAAYPQKPVHMIVPFAPGGASDFVGAHRFAANLSEVARTADHHR